VETIWKRNGPVSARAAKSASGPLWRPREGGFRRQPAGLGLQTSPPWPTAGSSPLSGPSVETPENRGLRNACFAERGLVSLAERWKALDPEGAVVPVQLALVLGQARVISPAPEQGRRPRPGVPKSRMWDPQVRFCESPGRATSPGYSTRRPVRLLVCSSCSSVSSFEWDLRRDWAPSGFVARRQRARSGSRSPFPGAGLSPTSSDLPMLARSTRPASHRTSARDRPSRPALPPASVETRTGAVPSNGDRVQTRKGGSRSNRGGSEAAGPGSGLGIPMRTPRSGADRGRSYRRTRREGMSLSRGLPTRGRGARDGECAPAHAPWRRCRSSPGGGSGTRRRDTTLRTAPRSCGRR